MNRQIAQPGAIVLVEDVLSVARDAMVNDGHLAQMVLGTGVWLDGLACFPDATPGMEIDVGPGTFSVLATVDSSDYGVLAADAHPLTKLAVNADNVVLTVPGSGTYIVEAAFGEQDSGLAVEQYYNAASPAQALSGPNGTATAQYTRRVQSVLLQLVAGNVPTAGYLALYTVVVPAGTTVITAAMISRVAGAPFLDLKLPFCAPLDSPSFTGFPRGPTRAPHDDSTNLATTAYVDEAVNELSNTTGQAINAAAENANAAVNALAQNTNTALAGLTTDLSGYTTLPVHNAAVAGIEGQIEQANARLDNDDLKIAALHSGFSRMAVYGASDVWTVPAGITLCMAEGVGGGGGASGSTASIAGAGGGGGGYFQGVFAVNAGDQIPITVGQGGGGSMPEATASPGGTSAFGSYAAAGGGAPGAAVSGGPTSGGAGGGGSGSAQLLCVGGCGGDGFNAGVTLPGYGGSSQLAGSVRAGTPANETGDTGTFPGGGGSGCYGGASNGGAGAGGLIIVRW